MAKKGSFSKVYDKNGDYVDVEAARFDGTRTFQMQGDVSATQTWNGDSASALTLNTSIGAKKVTTDKINDKAVQTGQIDDGAVGLTQIATNAMNGTVQDNDSKLATHAAVKTYVDSQISGQGTYLGKHTVAEINAMVTDNLHNGDRVMTSDSGTINLGPGGVGFDVEAGEDLILYKSGSTVQWDSMDGNFKTKQTAVSDPTASGTGLTFIDSISQDENGEITPSKKTVQDGTTSQKGVVQLEDSHTSTSTTKAATPNSVKEAYDLASTANSGLADKQDKPSSATENNIAVFNGSKSTKDSGKSFLPSTSTWDGTSDNKVPTAKAVQAQLDNKGDANKVVAIADAMVKRVGQTGSGWYKLAELTNPSSYDNVNYCFDVYAATDSRKLAGRLDVAIRTGNSVGASVGIPLKKFYSDAWISDYKFKIVIRGLTGSATIELWASCLRDFGGLAISERNTSSYTANNKKDRWTYTSYENNGGSAAPVTDVTNNVKVDDVDVVYRQLAIASPTNNNLVAMDANGLVKDSGKKAADFATAAQGTKADSAVQDVTVDGASVVNSSTKVAAVPNASTSAKGVVQLAGSIGATVASENNKAATEKAVRDAINALDAEVTSNDGTNVQVKVTETDGKISAVNVTTDNTENRNNKVSAWQGTPDNTHYPSEKLVKDWLDAKADVNKVVAIADAFVLRRGQVGQGWYKLAETTTPRANYNINSVFDVVLSSNGGECRGSFVMSVRYEGTGVVNVFTKSLFSDDWFSDYPIKIVTTKVSSTVLKVELYFGVKPSVTTNVVYSGISISEQNAGNYGGTNEKNTWTYTSYTDVAGSAEPEPDPTSNKEVVDVKIVARQLAIASPTNNNLVAMDANGIVKDSGLTKASVESAITSAGSAIQGVNVNNTTLTPDANKVVTVPLATTSADGAMSAADKTKLNGIAEGAEVNVQADWDETSSSADSFIKNKPYYRKNYSSAAKIIKVCSIKYAGDDSIPNGFTYLARRGGGGVRGMAVLKSGTTCKMYQYVTGSTSGGEKVSFSYVSSGSGSSQVVDIYGSIMAFVSLAVSTLDNLPKAKVDFTDFGTEVSALPEGATEITPVWVANSASSSGTAPVKVDAYGALTPVPMDSTPTASSTNLMTSGDIKTALDALVPIGTKYDVVLSNETSLTPAKLYEISNMGMTSNYSASTAEFIVYQYGADYNDYGNVSYKVTVHWTRSKAIVEVNGVNITGEWTAVVSNSATPSTTDVTTLKLYLKPGQYRAVRVSLVSCKRRGSTGIFEGTVVTGTTRENIPSASDLVIIGTTRVGYIPRTFNVSSKGSASVPVYVDAGEIKGCTDDFVHDAEIAKMVQVATAGTAAGSLLQPVYVNASGVATAIDYKKWNSARQDSLNALPSDWYKSEGSLSITSGNTVQYVELSGLNSIGGMDLWAMCNASNSPFMIRVRFNLFRYGRSGIQILDRSGYDNANIGSIIIRTDSNAGGNPTFDNVKIYFRILNSGGTFAWRCSEARTNNHFAVLTEDQYNALTSVVACSANCTRFGATSISSRHIQRGSYDVLDTGDVAQSYSSSSTAPISGAGVSDAIGNFSTKTSVIARLDSRVATSTTNNGWYKVAEVTSTSTTTTYNSAWQVDVSTSISTVNLVSYTFNLAVRFGASGVAPVVREFKAMSLDNEAYGNTSMPKFKLVVNGNSGNATLQLWFYYDSAGSMFLRELCSGTNTMSIYKQQWTYTSYNLVAGSGTTPSGDVTKDIDFIYALNMGDVTSTYSATGTAPVNGTAVASAIKNKDDVVSSFHSSSAVGYYKIANLTFSNINSVYTGAILKFVCRSFEALIAVSFSEYNNGNETAPIVGNIFVLNERNNILGNDKYDIYVLRTASQTYDIYLHLKSTPGNASVSLLYATNCTYTRYTDSSKIDQLPTSIASLKLPYHKKIFGTNNNTTIGSSSVPVYVTATGEVASCNDDFARDSEVVTNVEYVAAQSGGGGNLNKTKDGSTTSVLAFMTTDEAHSLWANAKANAS